MVGVCIFLFSVVGLLLKILLFFLCRLVSDVPALSSDSPVDSEDDVSENVKNVRLDLPRYSGRNL